MFTFGFEKIAATRSEVLGSLLNPINLGIGTVGGTLVGTIVGPYKKEHQKEVNKRGASNVIIPFVGPYRLARRMSGVGVDESEK